jgi:hypothetical protein
MMIVIRLLLTLYVGVICGQAWAGEDSACGQLDRTFQNSPAYELRAIAGTCDNKDVAKLFYNRAYHKDLLNEGKVLSGLITRNTDSTTHHITSYRLYIALVEELALQRYTNAKDRVRFLNRVYEHRGEVIELRLHGYNKLADALDEKFRF